MKIIILMSLLLMLGCDVACDMTYGTTKKTLNSDNAIYNYEYFKQQFEDIKSLKNKLNVAKKNYNEFTKTMDKNSDFDKEESIRLKQIVTGIEFQLSDSIADYNAKSKMVNRNIFKNGLLPNINKLSFND